MLISRQHSIFKNLLFKIVCLPVLQSSPWYPTSHPPAGQCPVEVSQAGPAAHFPQLELQSDPYVPAGHPSQYRHSDYNSGP